MDWCPSFKMKKKNKIRLLKEKVEVKKDMLFGLVGRVSEGKTAAFLSPSKT